jgi:hypothetical protein
MHSPYRDRDREAFVGKPAREARRRRRRSKGFDEQHLQQTRQDDITRGPQLARLFSYQLHEGGEPALTANVHELRQQRDQQSRVRRTKDAVADQQTNIRRAALNAVSDFAVGQRDGRGIDVRGCRRLET